MNRITRNYKIHVESVSDGRTFTGLVDLGFKLFHHGTFQLAGMELPDIRKARDRNEALATHEIARELLSALLIHPTGQGRTVILSPHDPNKFGRVYTNLYIPCGRENILYPNLTLRKMGYTFVNVGHTMLECLEQQIRLPQVKELLSGFEPYDFDK